MSLLVFVLIPFQWFCAALVFFLVAAGTDWADGYLARKHGLVTQLGRILDPFADKILICGVFIFLAAEPNFRVAAWMAVLVVGRELLVTALRSFLEQQVPTSASMAGKLKMVFQCGAAAEPVSAQPRSPRQHPPGCRKPRHSPSGWPWPPRSTPESATFFLPPRCCGEACFQLHSQVR